MTDVAQVAVEKRRQGMTLERIAQHLNAEGYVTRQGGSWTHTQVKRVLDRQPVG